MNLTRIQYKMGAEDLDNHCTAIVCFKRFKKQAMKGLLAILGLIACASAFQSTFPRYGSIYATDNQGYDDSVLTGIYNRFHGPSTNDFYQNKYQGVNGQEYKSTVDQVKDSDIYQNKYQGLYDSQEDSQGYDKLYKGLYNKYSRGLYNKYYGKVQDYLKNYYADDSTNYQGTYDYTQDVEGQYKNGQIMKGNFAKKQNDVYQLLKYINNPVYDTKFQQIYQSFDFQKYAQYYETDAFKNFMHLWTNQMFLPKGQIFSVFNDVHVKQVEALFKLFFTAKDYQTFFMTAVWARQHINEGMFLYTYSVAVLYRPDTQGLVLPAIYEIYPQYFFNSEVMQKAYKYKMSHYANKQFGKSGVYTIPSNYSGFYLNLNPEQSLSYYLEDVGINAFYYYINLYFPYWMNSQEYPIDVKRGEILYNVHQQLLARYYLERLSHGVGGFDYFNWEVPFVTGYYPSLTYPNGLAFSERPNFANLQEYFNNYGQHWCFISKYGYAYTYVNTYEQRIREAIDLGFVYTIDGTKIDLYKPEGMNILYNIIEGNADTPNYRYYGSYVNFARHLLGYSKQPLDNYKLAPSVLEHFETSMRDPAFYKLFKKVSLLVQKYKHNLPSYTKKDLYYPGVKVDKIEVDPLVTFYDKFYADITNGLTITPEEYQMDGTFRVLVEQYRLNHKNFNYKVYVNSDKTTKANIKVFIGPKYDEHGRTMDFYENRMNFYVLDNFVYTLKSGQNMIVRNSRDFIFYAKDKTSCFEMYKNIMTNQETTHYYADDLPAGYPLRYMLPRGSEEGMTFQLYVIVFPYTPYEGKQMSQFYQPTMFDKHYQGGIYQETKYAPENSNIYQYNIVSQNSYSKGYPFDRPAEFEQVYFVPNSYVKDVKIYHNILKTEEIEGKDYFPKYFV